MSKWGNFLRGLKIGAQIATMAGEKGVKLKGIPLDKFVTAGEKVIEDVKALKPPVPPKPAA